MNRKIDEAGERTGWTFLKVAVISLLVLMAAAAVKSYRDLAIARSHATELRAEIDATEHRIEALDDYIERIESDEATLEQLAREELGWVRDGDVVYVLGDEPSTGPGTGSSVAAPPNDRTP